MKKAILEKKYKNAFTNKLKVIYCVGENYDDYKKSETKNIIDFQLSNIFNKKLNFKDISYCL